MQSGAQDILATVAGAKLPDVSPGRALVGRRVMADS